MLFRFKKVKQNKALLDLKLKSSSFSLTEKEFGSLVDIECALETEGLAVNVTRMS
jgi:hypothetical protein